MLNYSERSLPPFTVARDVSTLPSSRKPARSRRTSSYCPYGSGRGLFSVHVGKTCQIGGVMMDSSSRVDVGLKELGLELVPVAKPVAEHVLAKQLGDLVYVSGQGPIKGGKPVYVGQARGAITAKEGYDAGQICILNELAAVKEAEMIVCVAPDLIERE